MSKLCCPVCWELLNIINGEGQELSLRGYHSVIYPVELPLWLPSRIVDKLTERFKDHLRMEVQIMLEGAKGTAQKSRHSTHESESNISVASTNFGGPRIKLEGFD